MLQGQILRVALFFLERSDKTTRSCVFLSEVNFTVGLADELSTAGFHDPTWLSG